MKTARRHQILPEHSSHSATGEPEVFAKLSLQSHVCEQDSYKQFGSAMPETLAGGRRRTGSAF